MKQETSLTKQTQEFWDENPCGLSFSWENSKSVRYKYTDQYLLDYLNEELFGEKQILEVGCGQGIDASEIIRFCKSYVGVDLSSQSLKIAKKECERRNSRNTELLFSANDAEQLGITCGEFDVVYSIGVLHHTENFKESINEIHRVLNNDGVLICMLYRSFTPIWLIIRVVRGFLSLPFVGSIIKDKLLESLRLKKNNESHSLSGTALLELVGSPIISTYSIRNVKRYLRGRFVVLDIQSYRTGIDQLIRLLPSDLHRILPNKWIKSFEDRFRKLLGFYMMIVAVKE